LLKSALTPRTVRPFAIALDAGNRYHLGMEITWLGHCCFRIRAKEATVVTDPCDKASGYALGRPTADLVTVSIDDSAHNYVSGVAGDPRVINGPGEFEIAGASVVGVATYRDREKTASGRNVAYVIELEDLRICHLGGVGHVPTSDQVEEIGNVDILMVPVGGGDSLDAPPAAETVSLIEPKLVIPMHFKTDVEKGKLDPIDRFLKEMGAKSTETHAKIAVTRSSLPEATQLLILDYKR
jgi:L-ascorbate metabolism protein UlaG (beta-lactamase superfamily)